MPANQTYLIAGASSGIGLQLATQLIECRHVIIAKTFPFFLLNALGMTGQIIGIGGGNIQSS